MNIILFIFFNAWCYSVSLTTIFGIASMRINWSFFSILNPNYTGLATWITFKVLIGLYCTWLEHLRCPLLVLSSTCVISTWLKMGLFYSIFPCIGNNPSRYSYISKNNVTKCTQSYLIFWKMWRWNEHLIYRVKKHRSSNL